MQVAMTAENTFLWSGGQKLVQFVLKICNSCVIDVEEEATLKHAKKTILKYRRNVTEQKKKTIIICLKKKVNVVL